MLAGIESLNPTEAILIALSGMVVVFIMLAILSLVIVVISKIVGGVTPKGQPAAAAAPQAAAPVAAAPAAPAQDQDELVAVLIAAIAAESDSSPDSFRIANIQAR